MLQLLKQKQNVRAIVRSKERLINSLDELQPDSSSDLNIVSRLDATEASLLDLTQDELQKVNILFSSLINIFICMQGEHRNTLYTQELPSILTDLNLDYKDI